MVELRRDIDFEGPIVTGFIPTGFKIGNERFDRGLLLSPERSLAWDISSIDELNCQNILDALKISPAPEFMLFGSGPKMLQPPASFRRQADALGMGIETMDSRAAAKAWGVLRAEERWVVAALMPLT